MVQELKMCNRWTIVSNEVFNERFDKLYIQADERDDTEQENRCFYNREDQRRFQLVFLTLRLSN